METLESSVKFLQVQKEDHQEMKLPDPLEMRWSEEDLALMTSLMQTPERGTIPDITCCETICLSSGAWNDPILVSDGSMETQEKGKVAKLTRNFQMRM
jgi:hypothetical protein